LDHPASVLKMPYCRRLQKPQKGVSSLLVKFGEAFFNYITFHYCTRHQYSAIYEWLAAWLSG